MTTAFAALNSAGVKGSVRDKTTLFFTFAFPLLFLLVFGLIFAGQTVEESGRTYISYIASGVLSWGLGNAAVFGLAFTLMQWRNDDLLRLIRLTPTPLWTVLGSRYLFSLGIALVQCALFIGIAMLPFFGLQPAGTWILALPAVILGTTAFLALGVVVGSVANTPEAVAAIANCIMIPMAFLSGSFLPLDTMPPWLQDVAQFLPLYYLNDGISSALEGTVTAGGMAVSLGVLALFTVVFTLLAGRVFRWSRSS